MEIVGRQAGKGWVVCVQCSLFNRAIISKIIRIYKCSPGLSR